LIRTKSIYEPKEKKDGLLSKDDNNLKENIKNKGKKIYKKYPKLRPFVNLLRKRPQKIPKFSGGGLSTEHEHAWVGEFEGKIFLKTAEDVKQNFKLPKEMGFYPSQVDEFLWRGWFISYAIRHAIKFSNPKEYNFADFGAGFGLTSFFALREISGNENVGNRFSMHLYDSWEPMNKKFLLESELGQEGKYGYHSIDWIKHNLIKFEKNLVYHIGFIPDSFKKEPSNPDSLVYLHIDINSAKPTLDTLEMIYPRLVSGGVIVFDDYGWGGYSDTKKVVDDFFHDKSGIVLKLPTGQALYFHH